MLPKVHYMQGMVRRESRCGNMPNEGFPCNTAPNVAGGSMLQGPGARVDEPTPDQRLGISRSSLQRLMAT